MTGYFCVIALSIPHYRKYVQQLHTRHLTSDGGPGMSVLLVILDKRIG